MHIKNSFYAIMCIFYFLEKLLFSTVKNLKCRATHNLIIKYIR